jgi:hypothetical protein
MPGRRSRWSSRSSAECLRDGDSQDRASNVDIIERDTRLLSQLSAADDDMTVSAERDNVSSPIEHMLDQIVRVVAEATRIWPGADERKGA